MNFSSILDISSFFIGMIINLLLVALVSYYFKRKYDHLEKSIDEHSDHIYLLLKKERDSLRNIENNTTSLNASLFSNFGTQNDQYEQKKYPSVVSSNNSSESDSESESESDCESECSDVSVHPTQTQVGEILDLDPMDPMEINIDYDLHPNITVEEISTTENLEDTEKKDEIKQLVIQESKPEETTVFNIQKVDILSQDYNKLTMKQLKDLLSNKGISVKPHMKKNDLIDLASKNSVEIEIDNETMTKNPSHISITDCDLELTNLNDTVTPLTETL